MSTRDGISFPIRCRIEGLPPPLPEYRFATLIGRNWRFDWAWPRHLVALEVDGGVWIGGRHTSGQGFVKDMEKLNEAAIAGWLVLRCVPRQLATDGTFALIRRALEAARNK